MGVRLIQVGLGGWGRNWLEEAIPLVPNVETVGVVDMSPGALEQAQRQLSLAADVCYSSLTTALSESDADAVLITAPLVAHLPLATEALKAGRHVLVEKPFGPTVEQAREVVELAEELGLVLAVSQNYRYYPACRTAARLLAARDLGEIGLVRIDFRKWANDPPRRPNKHQQLAHPLLYDMSIHHFDLMRMLLDQEPVEVYAKATDPRYSRFADEAAATLILTFSGGTVVSYRGSWASSGAPTPWSGYWHIECEHGEIAWSGPDRLGAPVGVPDGEDVLQVRRMRRQAGDSSGADTDYALVELDDVPFRGRAGTLNAFVEAISSGTQPETSGRNNLLTLAVCEAAAQSVATGRPVAI